MRECKCDLRTKTIGDGCDICNPDLALEHARELIKEQDDAMKSAAGIIIEMCNVFGLPYPMHTMEQLGFDDEDIRAFKSVLK